MCPDPGSAEPVSRYSTTLVIGKVIIVYKVTSDAKSIFQELNQKSCMKKGQIAVVGSFSLDIVGHFGPNLTRS